MKLNADDFKADTTSKRTSLVRKYMTNRGFDRYLDMTARFQGE